MLLNDLRLAVLEEFIGDYNSMLTGSQIAKKWGLNQKSVANALSEMEMDGFLKSKTSGRNRYFYLNLDNKEITTKFISAIEQLRTVNFYKKNPLVKEVISKIMPFCNGVVIVFGSYARGMEKKGSDLDLFIAGNYNKKSVDEISETYGVHISIKNYSMKYFEKSLSEKDTMLNEIVKNHVIISGVYEFVSKLVRFYYEKD